MIRFASLGSGSRGNATLIQTDTTLVLVDCGFAARELERRCVGLDVSLDQLDAILVTHEHGDHQRGVGPVARRYQVPVWLSPGTARSTKLGELPARHFINLQAPAMTLGDMAITPVAVPHDAREPVQFIFRHAGHSVGMLTDLGHITPHVQASYAALDAILLEANHDTQMLAKGPYPPALQARVGGDYGHLNNQQAAEFLSKVQLQQIQYIVIAHLSEQNNQPAIARETLCAVDERIEARLSILQQASPSDWYTLSK